MTRLLIRYPWLPIVVMVAVAVLVVLLASPAEATHQRSNGGTGFLCPHCSSWNLICKLSNVIDRCKTITGGAF